MKVLEANAGPLTNFEVLEFLRSKGAAKDLTRVLAKVSPSEYKVYDYLVGTPACNQSRENIDEFLIKTKKFDLAKSELLNIINSRPTNNITIFPMIEKCDDRMGEDAVQELIDVVVDVLPPPPNTQQDDRLVNGDDKAENTEQEGMVVDGADKTE